MRDRPMQMLRDLQRSDAQDKSIGTVVLYDMLTAIPLHTSVHIELEYDFSTSNKHFHARY